MSLMRVVCRCVCRYVCVCVSVQSEWPATIAANFVRRPTHLERNWLQYLGLGVMSVWGIASGMRQWRNGNLEKFVEMAALLIESNFTEHVRDPLGK